MIFLGCDNIRGIRRSSGYDWGCCCCRGTLRRIDKGSSNAINALKNSPPKVLLNDPNALVVLVFAGVPKTEVDVDA